MRDCIGAGQTAATQATLPTQRQYNQPHDAPANGRTIWRIAGPAWDAALDGRHAAKAKPGALARPTDGSTVCNRLA